MSQASSHSQSSTIAIDAMGGDHGVLSTISGANMALEAYPNVRFLIFGDEKEIQKQLIHFPSLNKASKIQHTDKAISSEEKPSAALRASKGTSMRLAIEAVKSGQAQAIVSSGNTGALMALAKTVLKTLENIHRPAIASIFPAMDGQTIMLDLGANVLVDSENLVQFAVLGAVFAKIHMGNKSPSIGLLNVGSEKNKGPEHVKGADAILSKVEIPGRYYGFVEGNDITKGTVDVVVSDGYAGNIALKAAEGVGKLSGAMFKKTLTSDPLAMLGGLLAFFALRRMKRKLDPRLYNGGVFLGLNGLCIKSHGGSDAVGFSTAVGLAIELAESDYIAKVANDIDNLMIQDSFL